MLGGNEKWFGSLRCNFDHIERVSLAIIYYYSLSERQSYSWNEVHLLNRLVRSRSNSKGSFCQLFCVWKSRTHFFDDNFFGPKTMLMPNICTSDIFLYIFFRNLSCYQILDFPRSNWLSESLQCLTDCFKRNRETVNNRNSGIIHWLKAVAVTVNPMLNLRVINRIMD